MTTATDSTAPASLFTVLAPTTVGPETSPLLASETASVS